MVSAEDWKLWAGAPGDLINGHPDAGSVTAVASYGPSRVYTQDSAGVPGTAESGDQFGASLASGKIAPSRDLRK